MQNKRQKASSIFGLMLKGKANESLQQVADASASDSKPSQSSRSESPEVEKNSGPQTKVTAKSSTGIETFAEPSAKRAKLLQQLVKVERQITDLEAGLVTTSDPAYSIFKGYSGLLPGNKRKVASQLPDTIFSDSSVKLV